MIGDYDPGDVIYFKFTSRRFSTGVPYTLAGTPALAVYKDNSAVQSTAGITLTVDYDSTTGLNYVAIDTSADGTFYSDGGQFDVTLTAGTIDSVSVVGEVVGRFTLRALASLYPTTAGRKLDVSAGGEAGVDWANIGSPTTAVNLSATNIDVDQVVASVTGAVGSVTGAVGSVTGSVGSVTGAVGSVTGNVGGNVVGSVGSVVAAVTAALNATGLDAVLIESGIIASAALTNDTGTQLTEINARQALALQMAALAGVLAGAATTSITIEPGGNAAGNTRVTATVDGNGNRSALTLVVPD